MPAAAAECFHQDPREELPRLRGAGNRALAARGVRRLRSPTFRLPSAPFRGGEDGKLEHLASVAERSRD
jgi:hypothetical protein